MKSFRPPSSRAHIAPILTGTLWGALSFFGALLLALNDVPLPVRILFSPAYIALRLLTGSFYKILAIPLSVTIAIAVVYVVRAIGSGLRHVR